MLGSARVYRAGEGVTLGLQLLPLFVNFIGNLIHHQPSYFSIILPHRDIVDTERPIHNSTYQSIISKQYCLFVQRLLFSLIRRRSRFCGISLYYTLEVHNCIVCGLR